MYTRPMDNPNNIDDVYLRIDDIILTIRVSEITVSHNQYHQQETVQIHGKIIKRTTV